MKNVGENILYLLEKVRYLLIIIPFFICMFYIISFNVNVVYYDQWTLVPYIEKWLTGKLTLGDLFRQHNEHRILFPRIIMLVLITITSWNVQIEIYLGFLFLIITSFLLLIIYKRDNNLLYFLPVSIIIFSLRQWENLLWGWQIGLFLSILFFVASIYFLNKVECSKSNLLISIIFAIISSYSFINGLLIWPIGIFMLSFQSGKKCKNILIWILSGLVIIGLFFYDYNFANNININNIFELIGYFFTNLGSPLAIREKAISLTDNKIDLIDILITTGIGFFVFLIICYTIKELIKRNLINSNKIWLAFVLFGSISSLMFSLGRTEFGIQQALVSRYTSITGLTIIGIYIILLKLSTLGDLFSKIIFYILLILIVLSQYVAIFSELNTGKYRRENLTNWSQSIYNYSYVSDHQLNNPHFTPQRIRYYCKILEKYKLNIFNSTKIKK